MTADNLHQMVSELSQRLEELQAKCASNPANAAEILSDTLESLQFSLEELSSADEELIQHNEELLHVQSKLQESESILRSFFDSQGVMRGIVEVIDDDEVRHIADNKVTSCFLGLTPEAMRGKLGSELGEPKEILRTWVGHYRQSQLTGEPVSFEYQDKRGDNEAWLSATVSFLGAAQEGRPRFSYIVNDITEGKKTELNLRRTKERLELAQKAGRIGIFEWDGTITSDISISGMDVAYGNPHLGLISNYENWRRCVHPDDIGQVEKKLADSLSNKTPFYIEYRILWPNGSVHWIESRGVVEHDNKSRLARIIGVNMDITERKHAEEAL